MELIDLREFCRENGIKQNWLAKRAGVSDSLLRYYMDRGRLPTDIESKIREGFEAIGGSINGLNTTKRIFK